MQKLTLNIRQNVTTTKENKYLVQMIEQTILETTDNCGWEKSGEAAITVIVRLENMIKKAVRER